MKNGRIHVINQNVLDPQPHPIVLTSPFYGKIVTSPLPTLYGFSKGLNPLMPSLEYQVPILANEQPFSDFLSLIFLIFVIVV